MATFHCATRWPATGYERAFDGRAGKRRVACNKTTASAPGAAWNLISQLRAGNEKRMHLPRERLPPDSESERASERASSNAADQGAAVDTSFLAHERVSAPPPPPSEKVRRAIELGKTIQDSAGRPAGSSLASSSSSRMKLRKLSSSLLSERTPHSLAVNRRRRHT